MGIFQLRQAEERRDEISVGKLADINAGLQPIVDDMGGAICSDGVVLIFNEFARGTHQGSGPIRRRDFASGNLVAGALGCGDSRPPGCVDLRERFPRQHEPMPFNWEWLYSHRSVLELRFA